ncbi:MAG TPA: TonB-dependent receptor [Gammaproteobacteria bacterium]
MNDHVATGNGVSNVEASPGVANRLVFVLTLPLMLAAQQAMPQDDASASDRLHDEPLEQIIVVAHKDALPMRDIAANVTVVSSDDLRAMLATSLADIFRYSPGVHVETAGTRFGAEGVSIRGIGGNRVAMLLDGVPLTDQFKVGSFSNATRDFIDAGFTKRIEVLHGPASALYGSAALGGVVAVTTPDPSDVMGGKQRGGRVLTTWRNAEEGLAGTGLFAIGDESRGLLLGASLLSGDARDSAAANDQLDDRDYEREAALIKLVADDRSGRTWRIGVFHQAAQVGSALNSLLGKGRYRSTTALHGDDESQLDLVTAELQFGSPGAWVEQGVVRGYRTTAAISQHTLDERALASPPVAIDRYFEFDQDIYGVELNLRKQLATRRLAHRLGFGVEYRRRDTAERRDGLATSLIDGTTTNVILGEAFPLRDFPLSESAEWGAYIEDIIAFGDWTVIGAIRADRYELEPTVDAMYAEDFPFAEPVSLTEADLSPKLAVVYRVSPETELYAQYAHGFRAPPYEDANIGLEVPLFNYRAVPNPDLRSEESDGIDLGMRWHTGRAGARLSLFRTRYTDFIESKVRIGTDGASGRILFQSQNRARAVIEGIEAGGYFDFGGPFDNLRLEGSMYRAQGENREDGQPLNSVGPAQAVLALLWTASDGRRRVRLHGTFTDAWDDRDESGGELFEPPAHVVFDLSFMQELGDGITLRAGLLNVADRVYWSWPNVATLSVDDPTVPYVAQAGRSAMASVSFSW